MWYTQVVPERTQPRTNTGALLRFVAAPRAARSATELLTRTPTEVTRCVFRAAPPRKVLRIAFESSQLRTAIEQLPCPELQIVFAGTRFAKASSKHPPVERHRRSPPETRFPRDEPPQGSRLPASKLQEDQRPSLPGLHSACSPKQMSAR